MGVTCLLSGEFGMQPANVMNDIETLSPIGYEIVQEISKTLDRLGAERGVFAALHSWGDTQPETEVLKMLREMNNQSGSQSSISTST